MDNRLKHIIDNYNNMIIGLDDTFRFHCKMCGQCCIHREDILLNPHDLFRIAKALNKEPAEVISEYCETYLGPTSRMVIVRLLPRGSVKRCPFLNGQKCSVHNSKPTVCALYPLGRSMKAVNGGSGSGTEAEVEYFFQKPPCGDTSETHTVREWLNEFGLLEDAEFFKKWTKLVSDLGKTIRDMEGHYSAAVIDSLTASALISIYLDYKTNEPFLPQFLKNDLEFRQSISEILLHFGVANNLSP